MFSRRKSNEKGIFICWKLFEGYTGEGFFDGNFSRCTKNKRGILNSDLIRRPQDRSWLWIKFWLDLYSSFTLKQKPQTWPPSNTHSLTLVDSFITFPLNSLKSYQNCQPSRFRLIFASTLKGGEVIPLVISLLLRLRVLRAAISEEGKAMWENINHNNPAKRNPD